MADDACFVCFHSGRCDLDGAANALAGCKLNVQRQGDELTVSYPDGPVLRVAYAAINARSPLWNASPTYHSYAFLDAQRSYDGPLEFSNRSSVAAVRYKDGPPLPVKHIYNNANWASDGDVWKYDLVLVKGWTPTTAQRAEAEKHGHLVVAAGNWQLWQRSTP
mgnify:CR=1 FL=1